MVPFSGMKLAWQPSAPHGRRRSVAAHCLVDVSKRARTGKNVRSTRSGQSTRCCSCSIRQRAASIDGSMPRVVDARATFSALVPLQRRTATPCKTCCEQARVVVLHACRHGRVSGTVATWWQFSKMRKRARRASGAGRLGAQQSKSRTRDRCSGHNKSPVSARKHTRRARGGRQPRATGQQAACARKQAHAREWLSGPERTVARVLSFESASAVFVVLRGDWRPEQRERRYACRDQRHRHVAACAAHAIDNAPAYA